MLALAESKEDVIQQLKKDVYSTSGVWDWDKVQVHPVSSPDFLFSLVLCWMYLVVEDRSKEFAGEEEKEGRRADAGDADWRAVQERVQEEYGRAVILKPWGCWSVSR